MTKDELNKVYSDAVLAYEQAVETLRASTVTMLAAHSVAGVPLATAGDLLSIRVPMSARQYAAARERDPYRVSSFIEYTHDIAPLVQAEVERLR